MLSLSRHAESRTIQRSITNEQISFVLDWGCMIHQKGRVAFHCGRLELEDAERAGVSVPSRVEGVTVVVARDGAVVTVIRSDDRQRIKATGPKVRSRRRLN